MEKEIWKPISGYEGLYVVSNIGNVKNNSGILITGCIDKIGYMSVTLTKNGEIKKFLRHRLVALNYIQNPESKRTVNHIDGNKSNNSIENLEWNTHSENHKHAFDKLGRKPNKTCEGKFGQKHSRSIVILQFDLNNNFINKFYGTCEAKRLTGISQPCISAAINGRQKTAGGYIWRKSLQTC